MPWGFAVYQDIRRMDQRRGWGVGWAPWTRFVDASATWTLMASARAAASLVLTADAPSSSTATRATRTG